MYRYSNFKMLKIMSILLCVFSKIELCKIYIYI